MNKTEITTAIRQQMKKKGISQKSLSEKTGLPQSNISRIFNDMFDVNYTTLCRITKAIGCEIVLKEISITYINPITFKNIKQDEKI